MDLKLVQNVKNPHILKFLIKNSLISPTGHI